MTQPTDQSSREQEREALHAAIRDAGGIIHRDGNVFFTNADQLAKVRNVIWLDEQGATHSVSIPYAAELLKQMFDEWPDGMNEIEAAMKWRDREIERLRALSPPSAPGNGEGDAWQPIETAPKDRRILLGYAPDADHEDGYVAEGRWWEGYDDAPDDMGSDGGFMDSEFQFFRCPRSFGAEQYRTKGLQPTHWQPLPSAPAQSGGQGNG